MAAFVTDIDLRDEGESFARRLRARTLLPDDITRIVATAAADRSDAQRAAAVALVREAVRMPEWRLKGGASYTVTGAPEIAGDLVVVVDVGGRRRNARIARALVMPEERLRPCVGRAHGQPRFGLKVHIPVRRARRSSSRGPLPRSR